MDTFRGFLKVRDVDEKFGLSGVWDADEGNTEMRRKRDVSAP
jgi:hypothetical protein